MATTLAQLAVDVAARLNDPGNVFYSTTEIYDALVEGMYEAALITGEPEVTSAQYTIPANTNIVPFPAGMFCILRLVSSGSVPVLGVTMWDVDAVDPNWENETGSQINNWFPMGVAGFGIMPQQTAPIQVTVIGLATPVQDSPNFTGSEQVPFETVYNDMLVSYASHACRLKEGGAEFNQSIAEYQRFLYQCGRLSRWAIRTGVLRFASGLGFGLGTNSKAVG